MRDQIRIAMQSAAAIKISHFDADAMISAMFEVLRNPTAEMLAAGEKAQLDWRSETIKSSLPPLFQGEIKP